MDVHLAGQDPKCQSDAEFKQEEAGGSDTYLYFGVRVPKCVPCQDHREDISCTLQTECGEAQPVN